MIKLIPGWLRWALLSAGAVVLLLLIWGVAIEPRLIDLREENAVVPNLPRSWEGKRLALIADFQVGMWLGNEATVTRIAQRIVRERPAAVLVAGDFVYKPTDEDEPDDVEREDTHHFMKEVNRSVALLHPLTAAGIPVYAVLGNHDYGMNHASSVRNERIAAALREALEKAGVPVLENRALRLPESAKSGDQQENSGNNPGLYLVGLGSRYAGNAKPQSALASVPENQPRIVFMHNPDSFPEFPAHTAPLALAGHTHGGQIRMPFTESWSWMALVAEEEIHADGWIDGYGKPGNRLYVNRGIGFSSFPVRINCRPELTLFTLRRENR